MTHKKRQHLKTRIKHQCPECLSWHHDPGELCPACEKLTIFITSANPFDFIFSVIGER